MLIYRYIFRNSCPSVILDKIIKSGKNKRWHMVLYGDKKRLRNIDSILNDRDYENVDKRFMNYVLTSRYFNKQIDYMKLSNEVLVELIFQFNDRKNELTFKFNIISDNLIESSNRRIKDMKRFNEDMKYYNERIDDLVY